MQKLCLIVVFVLLQLPIKAVQSGGFKPHYSTVLDSSKGPKLMQQCSRAVPKNVSKFWIPTEKDILKLEGNFKKILKIESSGCCFSGKKVSKLKNFAFQYLGIEITGKKYIYINAFSYESDEDFKMFYKDWKTEPLIFCDGGESVWGALFDLNGLVFSDLAMNGVA